MESRIPDGGEHWVEARGIRIHCRIDGPEGRPWLVFSNSVATDLTLWDDQVDAFGECYRILRYDQRGHGATSASKGDYSFDDLVGDAAAVLQEFDVQDAVFVGISIGGATTLQLGARHPDCLRAIVPCDCQWATAPGNHAAWEERVTLARKQGMEALVEPTVARWFTAESRAANSSAVDRVRQMIRATPVDGFVGCARALQAYDCHEEAISLQMPTLFVAGAKDGQMPAAMREMNAALPGSRFTEIANSGHLPNIESPHAFNEALKAFLDDVSDRR